MRTGIASGWVGVGLLVGASLWADGRQAAPVPPPLSPMAALKTFTVAEDLRWEQVLAEPAVAQPIFVDFDERGRMWVVQYLQYPFPAGLKILSEDRFLRAVYDKVPPPPPNHFRGRDKITIYESTRGDGVFDKQTTFIEGLNIVTACVRGRGGVWVLNPPYLLFYPDRNDDDVPDGPPVVHLEGFGLEDTHSCVNSLQWGPDGWLYACQGSTVTGAVKRYGVEEPKVHSMGQLIWRYHPETRRYEIFAEGGGNAFGLEIDSKGRIFSGHNGGNTRGFHYVQGAYLQKGFGKHGPLSNPYAFGYFAAMKHPNVPRFTHHFVIYEGAALPPRFQDRLFAIQPLLNQVVLSERLPDRSSFQTRDLAMAVTSADPWFRPVDIKVGPEGAIYVADMYEGHIAHLRHHEGKIDPSNGRIYRLRAPTTPPLGTFDLSRKTTPELVALLRHPNKWQRRMALRLLGDRKDPAAIPLLTRLLDSPNGQDALEGLWGLNLSGGFDDALAQRTLRHPDPHVRLWTVRLLGDARQVSPGIAEALAALARTEPNVEVRCQLACTAKRLPAAVALPIVRPLLRRDDDADDIFQPLLLWWAIESKCEAERDGVLDLFQDRSLWDAWMVRRHILHRLMRRFAQSGVRRDLAVCAQLLQMAPDAERIKILLKGFEEAYAGRPMTNLPDDLTATLAKYGGASLPLALRRNDPDAVTKALRLIADDKADNGERLACIQIFGEIDQPRCVPVLLRIVEKSADDALRLAALTALQAYRDPAIAPAVIAVYGKLTDDARAAAQTLLAARKPTALLLLQAVDQGRIDKATLPLDVVRKLTIFEDKELSRLIAKHWGSIEGATTAEMQREIARLEAVLLNGQGSPYPGKKLFLNSCGKCHRLFNQGGEIGPDLTTYQRHDTATMLAHIVNPSAEIREGFETWMVATTDGRVLTGLLADRDNQVVVLRGIDGQNVTIRRELVDEMAAVKKSLMPEGLLKDLTDQQVRDLFAYLRSTQPLND
ncbi:MAG: HEAT repeat domain-containing protein [Gemmataceae bacterium]|nr:HEAT repeat domain-containing protein [Gemmataceae bacterium]MDW8265032.1 HEAT repeat domain-containing protein [Gemmataceae bacterium]